MLAFVASFRFDLRKGEPRAAGALKNERKAEQANKARKITCGEKR